MRRILAAILATAASLAAGCGDEGPGTNPGFRTGYAETDITPPVGTILGGYGVPGMGRVTTGTHDPLLGQAALFVNHQGDAFLILGVDLAGYMWDFGDWGPGIKVLRQSIVDALAPTLAIRPEHIVVASSHSHGATDLMGFSQDIEEGPDKALLDEHVRKLTAVAVAAAANLRESTLHFGMTGLTGITKRDKNCSPVLDESVAVVQARDADGKVLVTIANFANHPTVAGEGNRLATADFVWGYREEMRKATNAPAMYLQGFEAAVHGKYTFSDGEEMWDKVYEVGGDLARAVQGATLAPAAEFDIRHRAATYACLGKESFMADAVAYMGLPKRYMTPNDDGTILVHELEVSWHQLGPAEFVVFPGEPSPEYAVMAKGRMVSPVRFAVGLGNDATGYIVEPESLAADTSQQLLGYELKMGLGPNAGPDAWNTLAGLGWFDGAWKTAGSGE